MHLFLKKTLKNIAKHLILSYSKKEYFSVGQVMTVIKKHKVSEKIVNYALALFCSKSEIPENIFSIKSFDEIRAELTVKLFKKDLELKSNYYDLLNLKNTNFGNNQNGINSTAFWGS